MRPKMESGRTGRDEQPSCRNYESMMKAIEEIIAVSMQSQSIGRGSDVK